MPTVTKRTRRPVEDEDDDVEVEEEETPRRTRSTAKKTATRRRDTAKKAAPAKRTRRPVDEDEDDEIDEEYFEEDDDDEEEEPPRRTAAKSRRRSSSRSRLEDDDDEDEDEDEDDDDDEDDVSARRRRGGKTAHTGIRKGWAGAEQTLKSGGGGVDRLQLSNEPCLIKFIEDQPFSSGRQHWVNTGDSGGGNRPYLCIGNRDCPLCKLGDPANAFYAFNVLHLSEGDEPAVRVLQVGTKAFEALKTAATNRAGKIVIDKDFWTVTKSGKQQRTQTNFRPVKLRDVEEDWPEVFESFDPDELEDIIETSKKKLYDEKIFKPSTLRQLKEVARYLADED